MVQEEITRMAKSKTKRKKIAGESENAKDTPTGKIQKNNK